MSSPFTQQDTFKKCQCFLDSPSPATVVELRETCRQCPPAPLLSDGTSSWSNTIHTLINKHKTVWCVPDLPTGGSVEHQTVQFVWLSFLFFPSPFFRGKKQLLCTVNDCSMEGHTLFYNLQGRFTDDAQTDLGLFYQHKLKAFYCSPTFPTSPPPQSMHLGKCVFFLILCQIIIPLYSLCHTKN